MSVSIYLKLLGTVGFKRVASTFIAVFGFLWLLIEPATLFFPTKLELGWGGYAGLVLISLIAAIILRFPRRGIFRSLSSPDSIVEIKVGDLFKETGHLVIGTNDVFDTQLGDLIDATSIQGQFLTRVYKGDRQRLDIDIEEALKPYKHKERVDPNKLIGKKGRYPIGTTIALGSSTTYYFLIAYGYMSNEPKCTAKADDIWLSLSELWEQVRLKGQGSPVAMAILGSGLSRTGLPRMVLIKMIIISFIVASKKEYVCRELTVVVHPKDLKLVNFYDLEEFLKSTCF